MSEGINDSTIQFGPSRIRYLPLGKINELRQVRTRYDEESLDNLATAIVANPEVTDEAHEIESSDFELISPITVGRHDNSSAKKYIRDHGDFYRIARKDRTSPDDLRRLDDGTAIISIAGHRRKRALGKIMGRFSIDPSRAEVATHERVNITFAQAQSLQFRENVYESPPVQDEARAIALFYNDIIRQTGKKPKIGEFAAQVGFGATKVREALAFSVLPPRVQAFADDKVLPYEIVKKLKPLMEAYDRLHSDAPNAAKRTEDELVAICNTMAEMDFKGAMSIQKRREALITNREKEIFDQAVYQQVELFWMEEATPQARRELSARRLSKLAFTVIKHQIKQSELSLKELDELQASLDEARNAGRRPQKFDMFDSGEY